MLVKEASDDHGLAFTHHDNLRKAVRPIPPESEQQQAHLLVTPSPTSVASLLATAKVAALHSQVAQACTLDLLVYLAGHCKLKQLVLQILTNCVKPPELQWGR